MTKRFFAILATIALLVSSCEPVVTDPSNQNGGNEPAVSFTITSSKEIKVDSNTAWSIILYSIENPVEGNEVTATADVDWINTFDHSQMGRIKFVINENPNEEARQGIITVGYADTDYTITVYQEGKPRPEEHLIEAPYLLGHYYGDYASNGNYNYYVVLSESDYFKNQPLSNDAFKGAGYKFNLDIYSTERPADYDHIKIPNGVYTFNKNNDGAAGTFLECASLYKEFDSDGFEIVGTQRVFLEGVLTVTDDLVKLEVVFDDPEDEDSYVVTFSGDYAITDFRSMSGGIY